MNSHRRVLLCFGPLMTALVIGLIGIYIYLHVPDVSDFYNLVYHGSRPRKPETTKEFLFAMPAMLIGYGIYFANKMRHGGRGQLEENTHSSFAIGVGAFTIIVAIVLYRYYRTYAFFLV